MEEDVPLEPLTVAVAIGFGDQALNPAIHLFRRLAA